jgi:hypothetical protein
MWLQIYGCRANVLTAEPPVPTLLSTTSLTLPSTLINTTAVTVNLSTYWSFATSYSLVSNPQNSASISGSTLRITGAFRNMSYLVTLTASNVSGTSVRIFTVSVTEGPPVPTLTSTTAYILPILTTKTPVTLGLAQYFNNGTTYALVSNPQASASIAGSTLTVTGNNRNVAYTLTVSATNISGTSATPLSVQVTESPPIPVCSPPAVPLTLAATTMKAVTLDLTGYFTTYTSYPTVLTVVSNPYASAAVSSSLLLTVSGRLRDATYTLTISGSNVTGTSSVTLPVTVTESAVVLERLPVDNMSSNTFTAADGGIYIASASSEWNSTTTPAYGVFNQLLQTDPFAGKWVSAESKYNPSTCNALANPALQDGVVLAGVNGEWLQLKMPMSIFPATYQIAGDMYAYSVYASNTAGQWALLDSQTRAEAYSSRSTYVLKSLNTTTAYTTFVFKITRSRMDTGSGRAAMMWFNIFGVRAEGDQTPPVPTMLGSTAVTLPILTTTTPRTVDLSLYFSFATGYVIVQNPASSASVSGSTLSVTGARRNMSYTVTIAGANVNGTSTKVLAVSVSESA